MQQPMPPASEIEQHLAPVYRRVEQRIARGRLRRRVIAGAGLLAVLGIVGTTAAVGAATRHSHSETFLKSSYAPEFASCVQKANLSGIGIETRLLSGRSLTEVLRAAGEPTDGSVSVFQVVYQGFDIADANHRAARAMNRCGSSLSAAHGETIASE